MMSRRGVEREVEREVGSEVERVLPTAYLPPVSYFVEMMAGASVIDLGEHFVKRSLRNRTRIMSDQGVMELTIPVRKANKPRQKISTVEIDNSKRWQHQHFMAIMSAYRSSPYYEHYMPYIEPLYRCEWHLLVDFNAALLAVVIKLLGMQQHTPRVSSEYIEVADNQYDCRPKGVLDGEGVISHQEYIQVFADREPYVGNLSILDILFCEGTNALSLLVESCR